jgi:hypothetical protein
VARLIGDKSLRMGTHYTRHVEDEVSIMRAFSRIKNVERTELSLNNGNIDV